MEHMGMQQVMEWLKAHSPRIIFLVTSMFASPTRPPQISPASTEKTTIDIQTLPERLLCCIHYTTARGA